MVGVFVLLVFAAIMGALLCEMGPKNAPWLSEGHEPDPDCNDCSGTGILNKGDEHQEMDCHCTDRFYY